MKKIFFLLAATLIFATGRAQDATTAWKTLYPQILSNIKAPTFRDKDYNIADFGAVPNDTTIVNHASINRAIATCSIEGGGRVIVPKGLWFTGPLVMRSNVNLHLEEGATLLFTTDLKYFPVVLTRWEGVDTYNTSPLIYAYGETNIAVTGKGTIDGHATRADWWSQTGPNPVEGRGTQRVSRPIMLKWAEDRVPLEERVMNNGDGMRVQTINFYLCKNVLIEDITLLRSPFWVIHPLMCDNLTVRGVRIDNHGPNGDGCDPESCTNVLIENCYFKTGDDCIAIKAGRNNDARVWNIPSQNIIVRNCTMADGHGGVVIGSEIGGGYKNLFVENCQMDSPNLDRVIRIKTNNCRGGTIENIYVRNVTVGQCRESVLKVNLVYEPNEICDRSFPPIVRNVWLDHVTCQKSRYGVMITALENGTNAYDIHLSNCEWNGVAEGNFQSGLADNVTFDNVKINGQLVKK